MRLRTVWLLIGLVAAAVAAGQGFHPAFAFQQVDLANTQSFRDGKAQPVTADVLRTVLGLGGPGGVWSAGEAPLCQYRVAFTAPVAIGSVMGGTGTLRYLKADAPYPGDPANDAHWAAAALNPGTGDPPLWVLPPGVLTRALLLTHRVTWGASQIATLQCYQERLYSVTWQGNVNAPSEYTAFFDGAAPRPYRAVDVLWGGEWRNAGKDNRGYITSPPITDLNPTWFTLSWREPQELTALALRTSMADVRVYTFIGAPGINPTAATEDEWKWVRKVTATRIGEYPRGLLWLTFEQPVTTRGIRLLIRGSHEGQVVNISTYYALRSLGAAPAPTPPKLAPPHSPFTIPYELPQEEYFCLVVEDQQGRRLQQLAMNTRRPAGANAEPWDLKDTAGHYVAPGTYRFRALFHPGLKLRYEMTAYPNVTSHFPDRAAWLTSVSAEHGWMADHTPPNCVAVAGDRVWLGSPVAESGVSLIECDLDGKKQWAIHSFAGFTGAWWLAADETRVYIGAPAHNCAAEWGVDPATEAIWGIDLKTHALSTVARLQPTSERKRGITAMDARDGKLYLAIQAESDWLANAAKQADVDLEASVPRYPPKRGPKFVNEVVPDPQNDFIRLFRLTGVAPGYGPGHGLTYLESTRSPSNRQYVVLAFRRPIELGSAVYPVPHGVKYQVRLSVLKPDAWPPDPEKREQWLPLEQNGKLPFDCVAFAPGTSTRALRLAFMTGEDDIFTDATDAHAGTKVEDLAAGKGGDDLGLGGQAWNGVLEGMKLLRRRYVNIGGDAKVRVNSGTYDQKTGVWQAQRTRPLSPEDPGIYVMEWAKPQPVRGLAILEIDGEQTAIDVFTGDPGTAVNIEGPEHWQQVTVYEQPRRRHHSGFASHNGHARYLDGYVDFGKEIQTRALRLRVLRQWVDRGYTGDLAVRPDRGTYELNPQRCAIYGVAPLRYLGGETPVDPRISERVEVFDVAQGKVVQEVYLPRAGGLALGPDGGVFAVSANKVVQVDLEQGQHRELVTDLRAPGALAVGPEGRLYVYDRQAERRVIRVYERDGKFVREIGKPGGYRAGPWDYYRFESVVDLDVDHAGHLWVVDSTYYPKRIAQFTVEGQHLKDFYGPTRYGGSGCLDPWDKTRLFIDRCEFALDWETGQVRLKNLTWTGAHAGEVPIRIGDRTYLVTRPEFAEQGCGVVHLYEQDHTRMVAAAGVAGAFTYLHDARVLKELGQPSLAEYRFCWSDLNADGQVQGAEVKLKPRGDIVGVSNFSRDLSVGAGGVRYVVKEFLPTGVPVYEEQVLPLRGRVVYRFNGADEYFQLSGEPDSENAGYAPDGRKLWAYPTEGSGVHGLYSARPYFDGQVVSQFGTIGNETAHAGDLGEFVVVHSNVGAWSIWTRDGFFAGDILHNFRCEGGRSWSFPEHQRGLDLTNVTAGQEHFSGYFCRSFADNKYYVVAGHNHASVVEVQGLDQFKRLTGDVKVTPEQLREVQEWERQRTKEKVYSRAPVLDCYRTKSRIEVDGNDGDWEGIGGVSLAGGGERPTVFSATYNDETLYVLYRTNYQGPMKNAGEQWDRLFKTGAAVDLLLGLDPKADPARQAPVAGDLRLLMTRTKDKYTAVLYRAIVPGTPPDRQWVVTSPVAREAFDEVRELPDVRLASRETDTGYTFEAAIPLATLGLQPRPGLRLKLDWGLLVADKDGNVVTARRYWANQATAIIADAPSEARLQPDLWGMIRFHDVRKSGISSALLGREGEGAAEAGAADEFLEELKEDNK